MTALRALHQWVPTFAARDAIGGHVIQLQRVIREELGLASEIYSLDRHADVRSRARPAREHRVDGSGRTGIIYHLSVGSTMVNALVDRPETLVVDYHNITPVEYFRAWEPAAAYAVSLGIRQTAQLAPRVSAAMADSAFNEAELRSVGYRRTGVVPILLDTTTFDRDVDEDLVERQRGTGPWWLFVGRLAPNKCQHDIVMAFAAYKRHFCADARLALVGTTSAAAYRSALEHLIADLDLTDSVTLTGSVSDAELGAWYRIAELFVVLSEHEGFCVPLIEAMHHAKPVLAFRSSAVTETAAGGALLIDDKSPVAVAAAADRINRDGEVRDGLAAAGRRRAEDFELSRSRARAVEFLRPLADGVGPA